MNRKNNSKGFTLVELLVVIAIIGILSVVALPSLFKNIEKSKVATLEADISTIKSAVRSVYADTGEFEDVILVKGDNGEIRAKEVGPFDVFIDSLVVSEIDTLSFPFKTTYQIMYSKKTGSSGNNTSYQEVTLFVKLEEEISEVGREKLERDLGDTIEWRASNLFTLPILSETDK